MNSRESESLNFGRGGLLEGRRALISGIGPGMGRDIAIAFARQGALLAIGGRTATKLNSLAGEIGEFAQRPVEVVVDISRPQSCIQGIEKVERELGGLDIVVNNAFDPGNFALIEDGDLEEVRRTFDVNFFGTLNMTRACIPLLKASSRARVVMINTMSTTRIEPRFGAYSASKAALASVTKTLARELGGYGIRVNGVHPGFIWGEANEMYFEHLAKKSGISAQEQYLKVASENCLGYIPHSREIVGAVLFFASDLSVAVTGQALGVNAGQVFQAP